MQADISQFEKLQLNIDNCSYISIFNSQESDYFWRTYRNYFNKPVNDRILEALQGRYDDMYGTYRILLHQYDLERRNDPNSPELKEMKLAIDRLYNAGFIASQVYREMVGDVSVTSPYEDQISKTESMVEEVEKRWDEAGLLHANIYSQGQVQF
jgi:hypothetical protein